MELSRSPRSALLRASSLWAEALLFVGTGGVPRAAAYNECSQMNTSEFAEILSSADLKGMRVCVCKFSSRNGRPLAHSDNSKIYFACSKNRSRKLLRKQIILRRSNTTVTFKFVQLFISNFISMRSVVRGGVRSDSHQEEPQLSQI